MGRFRIT